MEEQGIEHDIGDGVVHYADMKRRHVIQLVLLLVLLISGGAIVNVAVAWGCWFWASQPKDMYAIEINPTRVWKRYMPSSCDGSARLRMRSGAALRGNGGQIIQLIGTCSCAEVGSMVDLSTGWPVIAFNGQLWFFSASTYTAKGLLDVSVLNARGVVYDGQRAMLVPYIPIWLGFAINTIFYAAILWIVFFGPGMLKQTLRRRRGQCPACAYPVGTSSVCTECGNTVNPRRGGTMTP